MNLSWLALLWLLLALVCTLAGTALTHRRLLKLAPAPTGQPGCPRCYAPLEVGARFCGECGHRLRRGERALIGQEDWDARIDQ